MKLSKLGEFGLINKIRKRSRRTSPSVLTGIGDDAAVLQAAGSKILATTDMMIEGIHFDLSYTTIPQLGYKFLAVNISDILAMGGDPDFFLVSLGIPDNYNLDDIDKLYSGMEKIARKFNIEMVGGDTCSSKQGLILSGTLLGKAKRTVRRSGAREGDGIFVTKTLGDSAMGLRLLKRRGRRVYTFSPVNKSLRLMKRHLMPEPVPVKKTFGLTSMIDISDGLLIDLSHICDESMVGAIIYKDRIPVSAELAVTARRWGIDPVTVALTGGEDYALLFTAPRNYRTDAFKIGEIIKKGRFIVDAHGKRSTFKPEGYEHFKKQ